MHVTTPEPTRRSARAEAAINRSLSQRQSAAENGIGRLIAAGRHLMSSGKNPRVADIVEEAGLSNDAFYRYFPSKDEFVSAVIEDGALRLLQLVERQMADHDDPAARLDAAIEAVMSQARDEAVATSTRNILGQSHSQQIVMRSSVEHDLGALLAQPLGDLGSPDPIRDGLAASTLLFGRLVAFILGDDAPTGDDFAHVRSYIMAASRR
ncbi:MAG: TetR family transcriptional regulator [Aeromicrobium sp.]|nr:TetR family transcriptional regulator [Aeromicrobium sp.]